MAGLVDAEAGVGDAECAHTLHEVALDASCGLGAPLGEGCGLGEEGFAGLVAFAGEGGEAFVEGIDGGELGCVIREEREEGFDGLDAVFALEVVDDVEAVVDEGHAVGVEVDVFLEAIHLAVQVGEVDEGGAEALGILRGRRQVGRDALHCCGRFVEPDEDAGLVVA